MSSFEPKNLKNIIGKMPNHCGNCGFCDWTPDGMQCDCTANYEVDPEWPGDPECSDSYGEIEYSFCCDNWEV